MKTSFPPQRPLSLPGSSAVSRELPWLAFVLLVAGVQLSSILAAGAYYTGAMTLAAVTAWALVAAVFLADNKAAAAFCSRPVLLTLGAFAGMWTWTIASIMWSIAPDLTWTEINRSGIFLAFLILGIVTGRKRLLRSIYPFVFLMLITGVAVYALGTKTLPGTVDNIDNMARISVPLDYTNAVGLLAALAYPFALYFASNRHVFWLLRLFSVFAGLILLMTLFFTLSRGGFIAILIGLALYFIIVPVRLRSFGILMLTAAPAAFIGAWAMGQDALVKSHVDLAARITAASTLRIYLILALLLQTAIFGAALYVGRRTFFPEAVRRAAGIVLAGIVSLSLIAGGAQFVRSQPSFPGWVRQTYDSFTSFHRDDAAGTAHLLELASGGRWQLWQEAMSNWENHPLTGTGAQTFPLVHLMTRQYDFFVKQPHSLGFRMLSELGAVGFGLMGLFIVFSMTFGTWLVARLRDRWEKTLAGTVLSITVIYLVHTSYEWDWNMTVLTMLYIFLVGMLIGWAGLLYEARRLKNTTQQRRQHQAGLLHT